MENVITKIEVRLFDDGYYRAFVTKNFSAEFGGGETTIPVSGPFVNPHSALDAAKFAITVTESSKAAFEASAHKA